MSRCDMYLHMLGLRRVMLLRYFELVSSSHLQLRLYFSVAGPWVADWQVGRTSECVFILKSRTYMLDACFGEV